MRSIVVIGSSNIDLVAHVNRVPYRGETLIGNSFVVNNGGKGANQAVAIQRVGGNCVFVSKLGDDIWGHQMLHSFGSEGLCTDYIQMETNVSSGIALITIEETGENRIIVVPGANALLDRNIIDWARPAIEACEYIITQLEIPLDTVVYLVELASSLNKKIVLNPAPACKLPDEIFDKLYLITPNETEISHLSGISVCDNESAISAARVLLDKGVKNVIVTLGSKGSLIVNVEGITFISSFKTKAVDTVAAGDVFNGALVVALNEGKQLAEAAKFASVASAIAVTRYGAQASIPYRDEIDELFNM